MEIEYFLNLRLGEKWTTEKNTHGDSEVYESHPA
jgi:hypothetical protein